MRISQREMASVPLKGLAAVTPAVIQVYPALYVFLSSPKTQKDPRKLLSYIFLSSFQLADCKRVLEISLIVTCSKNSIIILASTLVVLPAISSMTGFVLTKIKFKRNQFMLSYSTLGLILPCQVTLIPLPTTLGKMGLLNTYAAIILPQMAFALSCSVQLFYSFSKFMPNEVIEAAIVDGCSPLQSYVKIVCPMSTNSLFTVGSMQAAFCWNDFIQVNASIQSSDTKIVTLGINDFVGYVGVTDWRPTFAVVILITIPTSIIYFLASRRMLAGITAGAVKGQSAFENPSPPSTRPTSRVIWAKSSQCNPLRRPHLARIPHKL